MKRIAIMQPYIFPYIGYFQLIHAVDEFVIFDDVNYINKGWINRNSLIQNGSEVRFTIPLIGASQNKHINEIDVSDEAKWKSKLLRTIQMAYSRAPHYSEVIPMVERIINYPNHNLGEYIGNSLREVCKYLEIQTILKYSGVDYPNESGLSAQDRIISICKTSGAEHYINPTGGRELYNKEDFDNEGLKLNFIITQDIEELENKYVSILHLLMNHLPNEISSILNQFVLE